jgi:YwiC-like protein
MATATPTSAAPERTLWRSVAVPSEHGGWGLTLEPVLLGLFVAPSWAGVAIGAAGFVAFLVRTPLKLVLVDRWRHRWLPRTRVAAWIAGGELAVLVGSCVAAILVAGWSWLVPAVVAAPLVGVELWFDMRSRSRRLVPELAGAIGIGSVAAAIAVAGGESAHLAVGLWAVIAARAVASIPFARVQIDRLRHGHGDRRISDGAQLAGLGVAAAAVAVDDRMVAGAVAVAALAVGQLWWVRRPPIPAERLGGLQLVLGLAVVAASAAGVIAS